MIVVHLPDPGGSRERSTVGDWWSIIVSLFGTWEFGEGTPTSYAAANAGFHVTWDEDGDNHQIVPITPEAELWILANLPPHAVVKTEEDVCSS